MDTKKIGITIERSEQLEIRNNTIQKINKNKTTNKTKIHIKKSQQITLLNNTIQNITNHNTINIILNGDSKHRITRNIITNVNKTTKTKKFIITINNLNHFQQIIINQIHKNDITTRITLNLSLNAAFSTLTHITITKISNITIKIIKNKKPIKLLYSILNQSFIPQNIIPSCTNNELNTPIKIAPFSNYLIDYASANKTFNLDLQTFVLTQLTKNLTLLSTSTYLDQSNYTTYSDPSNYNTKFKPEYTIYNKKPLNNNKTNTNNFNNTSSTTKNPINTTHKIYSK